MSLNNVATNKRIPWEQYSVLDNHATDFLANIGGIVLAQKCWMLCLALNAFVCIKNPTVQVN